MSLSRLTIINFTDVYKLNNFPSLATLIKQKKQEVEVEGENGKVLTICTGDFLAPYLLSSLDGGMAMVRMLNKLSDIVITGNHEDDVPFVDFVERVKQYKNTWICSNMVVPEVADYIVPYSVTKVPVPENAKEIKVGFIGVISNSGPLYKKNAFGGAKIEDPYDALEKWNNHLVNEEGCNFVLPLEHLYEEQDHVTMERFDFPVVLSGHDHHVCDYVKHGTRLLKAGADAKHAVVLDLIWNHDEIENNPEITTNPSIKAEVVDLKDYEPDEEIQTEVDKAYSILDKLKNTEIITPPESFRPLSSTGSRERVVSIATYLLTCLRNALNTDDIEENSVDCMLFGGGEIRGGKDYPDGCHLTLEDLKNEIQEDLEMIIVDLPGRVIEAAINETRSIGANPAFLQTDDGIVLDKDNKITHIGGSPFEPDRLYRTGTTFWTVSDGSKETKKYLEEHHDVPEDHNDEHIHEIQKQNYDCPVFSTLMQYFAKNVWAKVWEMIDKNHDDILTEEELSAIDFDHDGKISRTDLANALRKIGFDVDNDELSFVDCIMSAAGDRNHDGFLDRNELHVVSSSSSSSNSSN
eukprot:TRINITY_DN14367_c0_g1_i1.p1 TRINITY_DN14367_c0_g1~~TRINITY_DN14367_c0_g1_i1.p1  ORF type:complete len:578 (+),score=221.46 TRINITY_DN14367_c0_g1_i1:54-1787(+)